MTTQSAQLLSTARTIEPRDRLDLIIHALAQLPEGVTASICGTGPERGRLSRLATAYGVDHRLRLEAEVPSVQAATVVYPSLFNLRHAPLGPAALHGEGLVLPAPDETDREAKIQQSGKLRVLPNMASFIEAINTIPEAEALIIGPDPRLRGQRIVMLTNYPTHYRVRLLNEIAALLDGVGARFRVLFTNADPSARSWMRTVPIRFDHHFLRGVAVPGFATDFPLRIQAQLSAFDPSMVLVTGFSPVASSRATRYCTRRGVALCVWSGEIPALQTARSSIRRMQRARLLNKATFGLSYGHESGEYLRRLAPSLPVVYARNTTRFPEVAPKSQTREPVEVLALSRAVSRKGLDVLVDAFRLLNGVSCRLRIAGDGPELAALTRRAQGDDRIAFLGHVGPEEIDALYDRADVFAFPTRVDPFGLVLVEAFASGLPVVSSNAPGALGDLAVPGENCLVVDGHDPAGWASALQQLIADGALRERLGSRARLTVQSRWTIAHSAGAVVRGLGLGLPESASHPKREPFQAVGV